ncbi:MAG: hypothetical protein JRG97_12110 [Deltaproteobacteria bacterium]|nr:hypothetical protein [Deltaproteobacteria bacterium]MBW2053242.1 hypothetical protein [Deltaproteobacteria bacterium]MBW2141793.1 hypothetical protein [Deltaproteobacteria bacterium]
MKSKEMKKWMKGGTSLYRLTKKGNGKAGDRNVVLCGRNWVIRPMTD